MKPIIPTIILNRSAEMNKNGVTVANFCSPHQFNFITGEVLEACSQERSSRLQLEAVERKRKNPKGWMDLNISYELTDDIKKELKELQDDENIDIIIVPMPLLSALKNETDDIGKCRTIRFTDRMRVKIHSNRFCT